MHMNIQCVLLLQLVAC